jgi:hypothetical protein
MPLLIGHAAIGSLTYEVTSRESALKEWKVFLSMKALTSKPSYPRFSPQLEFRAKAIPGSCIRNNPSEPLHIFNSSTVKKS